MKQVDIDHNIEKIKDSFRYFGDDGTIRLDTGMRVLNRTHPWREALLVEHINKHKNSDDKLTIDGMINIINALLGRKI